MQDVSPESPEQRSRRTTGARAAFGRSLHHLRPGSHAFTIGKRVAIGVYSDGFIHAGNIAYLALVTLFPAFIIIAALAQLFGSGADTMRAVHSFLATLPPSVAELLAKPIGDVLAARTGSLLWLGALVGLWTVGSFIETIRDILRRAYGTQFSRAFWHYRLSSVLIIIGSVVLVLAAFSAQVLLTAAEQFVYRLLPFASEWGSWIGLSRIAPIAALSVALYGLFYLLTPSKYRYSACPKWPGALFTAGWWAAITMAMPRVLAQLGSYDLTYGSLAGVIVALIFFWLVGFGLVIGAHLNAALAESPQPALEEAASTA